LTPIIRFPHHHRRSTWEEALYKAKAEADKWHAFALMFLVMIGVMLLVVAPFVGPLLIIGFVVWGIVNWWA